MSSRKRPNLHEANRGFLAASGRKRIARAGGVVNKRTAEPYQKEQQQKPQIVIKDPHDFVLVCFHSTDGSLSNATRELLYVGRVLAGRRPNCAVAAIVFGQPEADLRNYGVDRVICFTEEQYGGYMQEEKLRLLEDLITKTQPMHVLFGENDEGDGDLARRLAVSGKMSIAPGVIELDDETVRRFCDGGWQEATRKLTDILVLKSGLADADFDFETEAKPLSYTRTAAQQAKITRREMMRRLAADEVPLVEANFILAGGNGIKNFDKFFQLARTLQASVAGSRVVVDDGKLPRECQVGATGCSVSAAVYIAIGISGAIQHLQGIKDCRYVVAVNTDESCDMVKRADLAIICDAGEWMDAMLALIDPKGKKRVA